MKREQFLGRVNRALRGAELPDVPGPQIPPVVAFADPVGRFVESAEAVSANVTRVADGAGALAAIAAVMEGQSEYLAWEGLGAVVPGWDEEAAARGWSRTDTSVGADTRYEDHQRIGAVAVGITTADVGIAATGSVMLAHGPGRPRSASLLVEHHVVLLPIERVVHSLSDAMDRVDWRSTSNVVAITGPSRTADIESVLTLGVHGPRHLSIVLIGRSA